MTRTLSLFALAGLAVFAVGCGPSTATVSGTVSHNGKKVVWGAVSLVAADGSTHTAQIARDGTYRIPNVPTGAAQVGVTSPDPYPEGKNGKYDGRYKPPTDLPDGAWFPLPDKFADPKKSGLSVYVGGGGGDLDLK